MRCVPPLEPTIISWSLAAYEFLVSRIGFELIESMPLDQAGKDGAGDHYLAASRPARSPSGRSAARTKSSNRKGRDGRKGLNLRHAGICDRPARPLKKMFKPIF